jgi:two-component sensor histidine kinase
MSNSDLRPRCPLHWSSTNSSPTHRKYGALSNSGGHIEFAWKIERRPGENWLLSSWREVGGRRWRTPHARD